MFCGERASCWKEINTCFPKVQAMKLRPTLNLLKKKSTVAFSNQMIQRVSPLNGVFFFSSQAVSFGAKKV